MDAEQLCDLVDELVHLPRESEWVEFKLNYHSDEEIGKMISALSNSACIIGQPLGYLVFGVVDGSHQIVGTSFRAKAAMRGGEELEHWLAQRLNPKIDFEIYDFDHHGMSVSVFVIPATRDQPVEFKQQAYVRVGSITRKLNEFPEKARKIWRKGPINTFEQRIAAEGISADRAVELLDVQSYFDLLGLPYPSDRGGVIERFVSEQLIKKTKGTYSVTALGAILLAKNMRDFPMVSRKALRIIVYEGTNKLRTVRERIGERGYAVDFAELLSWVKGQLPANEVIGPALRSDVRMYPDIAIRELVANALIHQDFDERGWPMIEIYADRVEISNPGLPLITPERFIDEYQSRNEGLADLLRRMGICEEKGSGIDKVIAATESFQLPGPAFVIQERHTKAVLFAPQGLNEMERKDKVRACYQHCCLKYVSNEKMTNRSLRGRFGIQDHNAATASRIIRDTLDAGLIKDDDPTTTSRKHAKYIPFWA